MLPVHMRSCRAVARFFRKSTDIYDSEFARREELKQEPGNSWFGAAQLMVIIRENRLLWPPPPRGPWKVSRKSATFSGLNSPKKICMRRFFEKFVDGASIHLIPNFTHAWIHWTLTFAAAELGIIISSSDFFHPRFQPGWKHHYRGETIAIWSGSPTFQAFLKLFLS